MARMDTSSDLHDEKNLSEFAPLDKQQHSKLTNLEAVLGPLAGESYPDPSVLSVSSSPGTHQFTVYQYPFLKNCTGGFEV